MNTTVKVTAVGRHLPLLIRDPYKNATARKHLITSCVSLGQRVGKTGVRYTAGTERILVAVIQFCKERTCGTTGRALGSAARDLTKLKALLRMIIQN